MPAASEPIELDHVVLEVRDPEASAAFYRDVLGLAPVRLAAYRAGEAPFVSARVGPGTVLDLFPPRLWGDPAAPRNPNHLCFTLDARGLRNLRRRLTRRGIPLLRTARRNFGARGYGRSVYFADPDGVTLEARCYPADGG